MIKTSLGIWMWLTKWPDVVAAFRKRSTICSYTHDDSNCPWNRDAQRINVPKHFCVGRRKRFSRNSKSVAKSCLFREQQRVCTLARSLVSVLCSAFFWNLISRYVSKHIPQQSWAAFFKHSANELGTKHKHFMRMFKKRASIHSTRTFNRCRGRNKA